MTRKLRPDTIRTQTGWTVERFSNPCRCIRPAENHLQAELKAGKIDGKSLASLIGFHRLQSGRQGETPANPFMGCVRGGHGETGGFGLLSLFVYILYEDYEFVMKKQGARFYSCPLLIQVLSVILLRCLITIIILLTALFLGHVVPVGLVCGPRLEVFAESVHRVAPNGSEQVNGEKDKSDDREELVH